jgi:hypothetical protein
MTKVCVPVRRDGCKLKKAKTDPEIIRRVILGELNRIFRDRYGPEFPDDDAGRDDIELLCKLHALHPTHGREKMKNAIEVWAPWMKKDEAELIMSDCLVIDSRRIRPWPNELRDKIGLSTIDYERLKAWHVPPIDKTLEELAEYRKAKRSTRAESTRRKAGAKPRSIYLSNSQSRLKPWESQGISRATWYRRRETSPSPVLASQLSSDSQKDSHSPKSKPRPCETSPCLAEKVLEDSHLSHGVNETRTERKRA